MTVTIRRLLLGTVGAIAFAVSPAQALTFNLLNRGGAEVGTQARMGFDVAASYWSSVLKTDATINMSIGFGALGGGILAQASSNQLPVFNSQVYSGLRSSATSAADALAVANLQPLGRTLFNGNQVLTMTANALNEARTQYIDTETRVDDDRSFNNQGLSVNTSVLKALGIRQDGNGRFFDYGADDATLTFSNQFNFDFDPRDGIGRNQIDFIGVAIHEIGHALGFVSGVDFYDQFTGPGSLNFNPGGIEGFAVGSVLDLFRYSAPGRIDWSTQNTPYFSIDGGQSQVFGESRFATGLLHGDGRQASHWKDLSPPIGVMDPTVAFGQGTEITALDLVAFDVMGWKVAFDPLANASYKKTSGDALRDYLATAVPEPATWGMMICGIGLVGAALRRKRTNVRVRFAL